MTRAFIPDWLQHNWETHQKITKPSQERQAAWLAFKQMGLPTKKQEPWKYTDLTPFHQGHFSLLPHQHHEAVDYQAHRLQHGESILLVFINGRFIPDLSDLQKIPDPSSIVICPLQEAFDSYSQLIEAATTHPDTHHPFAHLNQAMWQDGLFLYVPDYSNYSTPIHLLSLVTDPSQFSMHTRHVVVVGECARLTLLTEYKGISESNYLSNVMMNIFTQSQATLDYIKIQQEGEKATHLAQTFIKQHKDSHVMSAHFTKGGLFSRDDLIVELQEKGSSCELSGFYSLDRNQQYIDHHVYVNHHAPHTKSEMLYKGIADNKTRAVFNGQVFVAKEAQHITAHQANHHLLLSSRAEVYSQPTLEIYADEVKCQHGATTGQLNESALFYLCSRGISRQQAINMLLQGFTQEMIDRVPHADIHRHVKEVVQFD